MKNQGGYVSYLRLDKDGKKLEKGRTIKLNDQQCWDMKNDFEIAEYTKVDSVISVPTAVPGYKKIAEYCYHPSGGVVHYVCCGLLPYPKCKIDTGFGC